MKMNPTEVKMMGCVMEMYALSQQNGGIIPNISKFAPKHGVSKFIPSAMQKLGFIKREEKQFRFVGRKPSKEMISEIRKYMIKIQKDIHDKKKLENAAVIPVSTDKITQNVKRKYIRKTNPLTEIQKVLDLAEKAEKYNIPANKKAEFIKDFLNKK